MVGRLKSGKKYKEELGIEKYKDLKSQMKSLRL
jgi:hypothetical protein